MNFIKKYQDYIILAVLSLICYQLSFGFSRLNPTNINWIFLARQDWGQHYLGWEFFRNANWTFPLGTIPSIVYPIGTNITFTDSIPLMALLFKPFSGILPENFQYLGLWLLLMTFLNAFYSYKLLKYFKVDTILLYAFVILFLLNPVLMYRYMHPALCAHWLIVGSIYYYLKAKDQESYLHSLKMLCLFLVFTAVVSPYLTVFQFGFLIALLAKNQFYSNYFDWKINTKYLLGSLIVVLLIWFSIGSIGIDNVNSSVSGGYKFYGMNLNSLINSRGYSVLLKEMPLTTEHQFEGYMYLGVGLMLFFTLCLAIAIYLFICYTQISFQKIIFAIIGFHYFHFNICHYTRYQLQ